MVKSKAYTLNRLIAEVSNLSAAEAKTFQTFAEAISPRKGVWSTKVTVLNLFLKGNLAKIANKKSYGKNVKTRVLKALKARKRQGSDFSL
jgi:hypothetical protein